MPWHWGAMHSPRAEQSCALGSFICVHLGRMEGPGVEVGSQAGVLKKNPQKRPGPGRAGEERRGIKGP